jgi:CHAD domain-containing protein
MQDNEPGTRLGEDVEALHDMRVATRQLRGALRLFVPDELDETFAPVQAGARLIADALGRVRDLDVFRDNLRARADTTPADTAALGVLLDALECLRTERRRDLVAALDGPTARQFLDAFPTAIAALEQTADPDVTVQDAAPRLIRRRLRKLIESGEQLQAPTAAELHAVRIRVKHLRYATAFFKPWLGRRVGSLLRLATELQDTLGALHDGDVAPDVLRVLVDAAPARGGVGPAVDPGLARAVLGIIHDHQQRRDRLLIRFREQWVALREIGKTRREF